MRRRFPKIAVEKLGQTGLRGARAVVAVVALLHGSATARGVGTEVVYLHVELVELRVGLKGCGGPRKQEGAKVFNAIIAECRGGLPGWPLGEKYELSGRARTAPFIVGVFAYDAPQAAIYPAWVFRGPARRESHPFHVD